MIRHLISLPTACQRGGVRSLPQCSPTAAPTSTIIPPSSRPLKYRLLRCSFTTSPPAAYKQVQPTTGDLPIPSATAQQPHIPPYPYGERLVYKQSNTSLSGNARIRFGNTSSGASGNNVPPGRGRRAQPATRRQWRPNMRSKRLWSEALGCFVRTRITTRVLRTVDKVGGLDNYLLGNKPARLRELGPWGWKLRWRLMQAPKVIARFAAEWKKLGLPPRDMGAETLEAEAEMKASGTTAAEVTEETTRMLAKDEEFAIDQAAQEESEIEMDRKDVNVLTGRKILANTQAQILT